MRYRKKPIEVEAVRWNGYDGVFEILEEWAGKGNVVERQANDSLAIHTLNGTTTAKIGDVVVREPGGEVFVVAGSMFDLAYTPIEDEVEA